MIYLIILGVLFFIQLLAASWYDLAKKTAEKKKAFKHKLLCSATYIAGVFICAAIKGEPDFYTLLFTGAFILLFIHDIIEEQNTRLSNALSSFLGNIAFLSLAASLLSKNTKLFNNELLSSGIQYIILLAVAVICIVVEFKSPKISQLISSAFLLVIALTFGISLQNSGIAKMQTASCAVIMGALGLAVSNAINTFDKTGKKSLLRINLYYFGLMFISCSVAVL